MYRNHDKISKWDQIYSNFSETDDYNKIRAHTSNETLANLPIIVYKLVSSFYKIA